MNTKENAERDSVESAALLGLLADIRAAVGDPMGRLMQDELVARCRKLRDTLLFIRDECNWETPRGDFGGGGDERIGPAITAALDWPNGAAPSAAPNGGTSDAVAGSALAEPGSATPRKRPNFQQQQRKPNDIRNRPIQKRQPHGRRRARERGHSGGSTTKSSCALSGVS